VDFDTSVTEISGCVVQWESERDLFFAEFTAPQGSHSILRTGSKNYFVGLMLTQDAANHSQFNYFVTPPPQKIESSEWDSVSFKPTS